MIPKILTIEIGRLFLGSMARMQTTLDLHGLFDGLLEAFVQRIHTIQPFASGHRFVGIR